MSRLSPKVGSAPRQVGMGSSHAANVPEAASTGAPTGDGPSGERVLWGHAVGVHVSTRYEEHAHGLKA
eukprot:2812549-Prymnesium_polylepis.2